MKYLLFLTLTLSACASYTPRYEKCLRYCENQGLTCKGAAKNGKFVCGPSPTDTKFPKQ